MLQGVKNMLDEKLQWILWLNNNSGFTCLWVKSRKGEKYGGKSTVGEQYMD